MIVHTLKNMKISISVKIIQLERLNIFVFFIRINMMNNLFLETKKLLENNYKC